MLTVEPWEAIRRKVLVEGCSQRGAAQELGHSRKTVAKALAEPVPPGYRLKEPRKKPVMGPVAHLIEAWLEQEKDWPRKQRQTAQRIYERLMEERKEFRGHPGTVRRYIQGLARRRGGEVYMPLAFEPGEEAQVDWHDGWAFEDGQSAQDAGVRDDAVLLEGELRVFVRAGEPRIVPGRPCAGIRALGRGARAAGVRQPSLRGDPGAAWEGASAQRAVRADEELVSLR